VGFLYGAIMVTKIKDIDNDSVIIYSSTFDRFYLKNLSSQLISSEGYKTADDVLIAFKNDKVIWVAGIKK